MMGSRNRMMPTLAGIRQNAISRSAKSRVALTRSGALAATCSESKGKMGTVMPATNRPSGSWNSFSA